MQDSRRRRSSEATGLALLVALGTACAPAGAPASPVTAGVPAFQAERQPASPASEAKRGGILMQAQQGAMETLHPWKGDATIARALSGVYEPLVRLDHREGFDFRRDKEIKPGLAERWENPDPVTYLFHLRRNVKWHDGQPMTADDVVFSLRTWMDPKEAPEPRRSAGALLKEVEKIDQYAVRVTTVRPSAGFLEFMAFQRNVYIAPKHVADLAKTVVGTGPFRVVKADINSVVVVERNADFYLPERPYLDGGKVFSGMERAQQQAAFIAKAIDFTIAGDQAQFEALKKQVGEQVKSASYLQNYGVSLYMKLDRAPFSDIQVRRAAHLAIDRQGLIKTVTFGAGAINPPGGLALHGASIPLEEMQTLPGWRQPKDQDVAEARRLLAEAGYPEGFKVGIQTAKDRTTAVPILEGSAPMLKAVGIDAQIQLLERAVFLENQRNGQFEAMMDLFGSDPPSQSLLGFYHSKGSLNKAPINDPELDALIEEQDRTIDRQKAGELYQRVQRLVLEKHYTIPTIEVPSFIFWQPWLHGFNQNFGAQGYIPQWDNVWIDPDIVPQRSLQ